MSTINFNDSIYAQEALSAFVSALTPVSIFSHSYNNETNQKGGVVYVPRVDSVSTTTFSYSDNSGFPYEQTGGVVNTITVTLDQHILAPLDFTDLQWANSSAADFKNFAQIHGQTLAGQVLQKIWGLFTTVNFGLPIVGVSIAAFSRASTVSIRTVMAKRNVDPKKLSLIVNEDVMNSWLNDATIYQTYSSGMDVVRDGKVSKLASMAV